MVILLLRSFKHIYILRMVHDSSVTSRRLADLCFNDMAALKAASDLVPRQKQLIERLASVK